MREMGGGGERESSALIPTHHHPLPKAIRERPHGTTSPSTMGGEGEKRGEDPSLRLGRHAVQADRWEERGERERGSSALSPTYHHSLPKVTQDGHHEGPSLQPPWGGEGEREREERAPSLPSRHADQDDCASARSARGPRETGQERQIIPQH